MERVMYEIDTVLITLLLAGVILVCSIMLLLEANIPEFLQSSPYLQLLLSNGPFPEEGLEIPDGSGKQDLIVTSKANLIELLSTLRFWLVPEVAEQSSDLLMFAFLPESKTDFVEVAAEFRNDIPLVNALLMTTNSSEKNQLKMAAKFGRLCVLRYLCEEVGLESNSQGACVAAEEGHIECLTYLHSRGAILDIAAMQAAARGGHFNCVQLIVKIHGGSESFLSIAIACRVAAEHGHLTCVKQMLAEWGDGDTYVKDVLTGAAQGGHLELLVYATSLEHDEEIVHKAMSECVRNGHLECLEHLHSLGYAKRRSLVSHAVQSGHVRCLQFLHEHNYPENENVCFYAATLGQLECLMYAHEQGMPWDENTCLAAAARGHLACLQYAREHSCPWWDGPAEEDLPVNSRNRECANRTKVAVDMASYNAPRELIAVSACRAPTIDCLLYVLEQGAALSLFCATHAARSKSLATLQFLHARGFTWECYDCAAAIYFGSFECLRFLHEIGTPWDERITLQASKGRIQHTNSLQCSIEMEVVEYLHTHGCPWHEDTCTTAAQKGSLECLQYAHEHGAPWTSEVCRRASTVECYEYAVTHGCPGAELNKEFFNRAK